MKEIVTYLRPIVTVPFFVSSSADAKALVAQFTALVKKAPGYSGSSTEVSKDNLTSVTTYNWTDKVSYDSFISANKEFMTNLASVRKIYMNMYGITRSVEIQA